jgi:hypothetical protein
MTVRSTLPHLAGTDGLLRRTVLPENPHPYYDGVTVEGDVPLCGPDDNPQRQLVIGGSGASTYVDFPIERNLNPLFRAPAIDDRLLRRILTAMGGMRYNEERGGPREVHLCRAPSETPGAPAGIYASDNAVINNVPAHPAALRQVQFEFRPSEIVALVRGVHMQASHYLVNPERHRHLHLAPDRTELLSLIDFVRRPDSPIAPGRRGPIVAALREFIRSEIDQASQLSWAAKWGPLLSAVGAVTAVASIGGMVYMVRLMRQQSASLRRGGLQPGQSAVEAYGRDLLREARDGLLEPVIGREREINAIRAELGKGKTANPTLVGPAGSGKSTIAEGLAHRILAGDYPELPPGRTRLVELNLGRLTEGASIRGDIESRLGAFLREVGLADRNGKPVAPPDGHRVIIFIDEIHSLTTIGRTDGSPSVGELLKPFTARRGISILGATTGGEYYRMTHHDHHRPDWEDEAIVRRYPAIPITPMSREETERVLIESRAVYERTTGQGRVRITDEAIQEAVRLADAFEPNQHFPHKGIDALSRAVSEVVLNRRSGEIVLDARMVRESFMRFKGMNQESMELELSLREQEAREDETARARLSRADIEGYLRSRDVPTDRFPEAIREAFRLWDALSEPARRVYLNRDADAERQGRIPRRFLDRNAAALGVPGETPPPPELPPRGGPRRHLRSVTNADSPPPQPPSAGPSGSPPAAGAATRADFRAEYLRENPEYDTPEFRDSAAATVDAAYALWRDEGRPSGRHSVSEYLARAATGGESRPGGYAATDAENGRASEALRGRERPGRPSEEDGRRAETGARRPGSALPLGGR